MLPRKKYNDFIETNLGKQRRKKHPWDFNEYVGITCPACQERFAELTVSSLKTSKASTCLKHTRTCQPYLELNGIVEIAPKRIKKSGDDSVTQATVDIEHSIRKRSLVTIYRIVFLPQNRVVYTGRSNDPARRLKEHSSASSSCRLLRNAIRRHGVSKFAIQPIVCCHPDDADANESYYIMANNTMHPNGFNLRHGSRAGIETESDNAIVPTGIVTFKGAQEELLAQADAVAAVADICRNLEDSSSTEDVCLDLLRQVHPDRAGDRMYTPEEVSAMLNTVRESTRREQVSEE